MKTLRTMTEQELKDYKVKWPKTKKQLDNIIKQLTEREHNYGTCTYAMSIAATATFYYMSSKLGVTGFQASCADLDVLSRTRNLKQFRIVNIENLLYPQYCNEEHFPSYLSLIESNKEFLKKEAIKLLMERDYACNRVLEHWTKLSKL